MMRKGRFFTALLLFVSGSAFSQVNYVLNGDFESHTGCPTANNQIKLAKYWSGIDSLHESNCNPDYCHACADINVAANNSVPRSMNYYQHPHSGNGMTQAEFYYDDFDYSDQVRTYLQGRLYKQLTAGVKYCVSFYVSLEECSAYAVKELSAYLDDGKIDTASVCYLPLTQCIPQITNSGGIITDTMNWVKVEGSFIAKGNEKFITIGNFKDRTHTTATFIPTPSNITFWYTEHDGLYLVDDVVVVESDTKADAGPDTHVGQGDSVYIGRLSFEAIWCDWRVLGSSTIIGKGPGIWVKPIKATYYECTQTLCGAVTKDTVKVDVWKLGVTGINGQTQQYSISPNPNNGLFRISQSVAHNEVIEVALYNMLGRQVYSRSLAFKDGSAAMTLTAIPAGVYYMYLCDDTGCAYERLVKE